MDGVWGMKYDGRHGEHGHHRQHGLACACSILVPYLLHAPRSVPHVPCLDQVWGHLTLRLLRCCLPRPLCGLSKDPNPLLLQLFLQRFLQRVLRLFGYLLFRLWLLLWLLLWPPCLGRLGLQGLGEGQCSGGGIGLWLGLGFCKFA